jgi:UTP--glucose-1-phosphate uridylyltransferase
MKIKKAIIPAAGLGTRFLPATKAQPKEMLPLVDTPTIQYIVEEAIQSGIEDIIIVTGRGKRAIEDHFDYSVELESVLERQNKHHIIEEVRSISDMANIHYIRQKEPRGLGHAIWCARKFIGNEPFAVLLGDDIVVSEEPCLKQLINIFELHQSSVLGVQEVPANDVSKYGIVAPINVNYGDGIYQVRTLVEKPKVEDAPSTMAIMGRYILQPEIFEVLEAQQPGAGGEIQLTDAIKTLNERQKVLAYCFNGIRYDVGDKFGFVKATIDFALQRSDLREQVAEYIAYLADQGLPKPFPSNSNG